MNEEAINFIIAWEESKHAKVDSVMEIHIEESSHVEKPYIEAIQDMYISYGDLVGHDNEEFIKIEITSKIKEQEDMLAGDDSYCTLVSIDFKIALKFKLFETLCKSI